MMKRLAAFAVLAFFASPAHAQYNYPLTVGTSPAAVLTVNPSRRRLIFVNPNATAKIAVCPKSSRGSTVVCAVNGAGSITLLPYASQSIDGVSGTSSNLPSAWDAVSDTSSSPFTILEFE